MKTGSPRSRRYFACARWPSPVFFLKDLPSRQMVEGYSDRFEGVDVGNVLDALPTGLTPTLVRLAMACACVASIPIGLVGCGEILEARIPRCRRIVVRSLVAVAAALVAYAMPAFALVVGLVGAVAVCTLSFALPPLVHLLLARRNSLPIAEDVVLLIAGVLLVVVTTTLTARTTAAALAEAYADDDDFLS